MQQNISLMFFLSLSGELRMFLWNFAAVGYGTMLCFLCRFVLAICHFGDSLASFMFEFVLLTNLNNRHQLAHGSISVLTRKVFCW